MKKLLTFLSLLFFSSVTFVFAATSYPDYSGYVNDFAHVLSQTTISQLTDKLSNLDKQTTDQIAVVTVQTTDPEAIEEYSIHLADKWKVGQKGKDNGVIMLFAMQDHQMRIEVGRGLEGDLTDIQAKHIETDIIRPEFKQGNYDAGVSNGVDAVIAIITHTATSSAPLAQTTPTSSSDPLSGIVTFIIIVLILLLFFGFSPLTLLGGRGTWGPTIFWGTGGGNSGGGSGFGGFGGGSFSGGGASSSW